MTDVARIEPKQNGARGLTAVMAERFQMEPSRFVEAIKATVMPGNVNEGQLAAFLMVAHEYGLNPLTKEVYAFPSKGGIQPIVSIDGWMKMINSHPQFDGMEFQDQVGDDGKVLAITCKIFRKDRGRPTEATEYMAECERNTEPWNKWPHRMLRHKAAIQCARYAFSFAGVMDEDDFDRMKDVTPEPKASIGDRLNAAREGTATIEHEGFDPDHVARETATVDHPGDHHEDQNSDAPPPASDQEAADMSSADASTEGGEVPPPASPPSADSKMIECAKKLLDIAKDETMTPQVRMGVLAESVKDWRKTLPEAKHPELKQILRSAEAVIRGDTSHESAVEFFTEALGCKPEDIGGAAG